MKYQSEIIHEILEQRGHEKSSLHYQTECIETWIKEAKGAYPKLCDYESEWLNYIGILDDTGGSEKPEPPIDPEPEPPIGKFPYVTLTDVTEATVDNVVPYAYKSAILKGRTLINVNRSNYTTNTNITDDYGQAIEFYDADMLPNTTYTIIMYSNNPYECRFSQMYNGREYALSIIKVGTPFVFTTAENYQGLRSYLKGDELNIPQGTEIKILIIEGDYTNIDIPYFEGMQSVKMPVLTTSNEDGTKSIILTVNEDVELRGVGDVKDELDYLTGEVRENIGDIVLDGTQDMSSDGYGVYIQVNDIKRFLDYTDKIACDKLPVIPSYQELENVENGISGFSNSGSYLGQNWLYVKINNSVNTDEIKEWLTQNPITVQYQLATESIKTKTVGLSIADENGHEINRFKPIEGTMHIQTDGTPIKPTVSMEIPVEAITQNLASFIETEV